MIFTATLILATCTWYHPGPHVSARCANGKSYAANLRRYGAICASRSGKFGERKTIHYHGRSVAVYVVDRPGANVIDLDPKSFQRLAPLTAGRLHGVVVGTARRGRHKKQ